MSFFYYGKRTRKGGRGRERERVGQTDRQTETETETETGRETDERNEGLGETRKTNMLVKIRDQVMATCSGPVVSRCGFKAFTSRIGRLVVLSLIAGHVVTK